MSPSPGKVIRQSQNVQFNAAVGVGAGTLSAGGICPGVGRRGRKSPRPKGPLSRGQAAGRWRRSRVFLPPGPLPRADSGGRFDCPIENPGSARPDPVVWAFFRCEAQAYRGQKPGRIFDCSQSIQEKAGPLRALDRRRPRIRAGTGQTTRSYERHATGTRAARGPARNGAGFTGASRALRGNGRRGWCGELRGVAGGRWRFKAARNAHRGQGCGRPNSTCHSGGTDRPRSGRAPPAPGAGSSPTGEAHGGSGPEPERTHQPNPGASS